MKRAQNPDIRTLTNEDNICQRTLGLYATACPPYTFRTYISMYTCIPCLDQHNSRFRKSNNVHICSVSSHIPTLTNVILKGLIVSTQQLVAMICGLATLILDGSHKTLRNSSYPRFLYTVLYLSGKGRRKVIDQGNPG